MFLLASYLGEEEKFDREMIIDVLMNLSVRYRSRLPVISYALVTFCEMIKSEREKEIASALLQLKDDLRV